MNFKSTEQLLQSQQSLNQDPLVNEVKFVKPKYEQSFDLSSSSSAHSNIIRRKQKITIENVQVHRHDSIPSLQTPVPVPRKHTTQMTIPTTPNIELKSAKDTENEMIQMNAFTSPAQSQKPCKQDHLNVENKARKLNLDEISDISTVSHDNKPPPSKNESTIKVSKGATPKNVSPFQTVTVQKSSRTNELNKIIVHKSGIWGDTLQVPDETSQKLSEYEKENDESLKEKASVQIVNEKLIKPKKLLRPKTGILRQNKPKRTDSSQKLYRKSASPQNTSSETNSDEEIPAVIVDKRRKHKHHKKHHHTDSGSIKSSSRGSLALTDAPSPISREESQMDNTSLKTNQILGVYIHNSTDLKFDMKIKDPRVHVSLVDERTGALATYNHKTLKIKQMEQPFILPLVTKSCEFVSKIAIKCRWEDLLCFQENISHPDYKNTLIFFELLDHYNIDNDDYDGHYPICWSFLKPFRGDEPFHFNKRLKLQMYFYQKLTKRMKLNENVPVYNQWSLKKKRYPAVLEVTVKEMIPMVQDHTEADKKSKLKENAEELTKRMTTDLEHLKDSLLGRSFQIPKTVVHKKRSSRKGSLLSQFSTCGHYLAFTDVMESETNIYILSVPDFMTCHILRGHTGLVHDLEWINSIYLISASADHNVILWSIENGIGTLLKIMPHTSFVYAAKCICVEKNALMIVSGGRDGLIRVWKCNNKRTGPELSQELEGHEDYITNIVCSQQGTVLSADAFGVIIEWKYYHKSLIKDRKIEIEKFRGQLITDMLLHTTECKLYVQLEKSWEVYMIGIPSGILMHKLDLKEKASSVHQSLSISPCGTYLFCPNGSKLVVYNLINDYVESEIKIPYVHSGKSFIACTTASLRYQVLAISIYGYGGGLVVFGFDQYIAEASNVEKALKPTEKWELNETTEIGAHLKEMIQKIDDVFLATKSDATLGTKSLTDLRNIDKEEESYEEPDDSEIDETGISEEQEPSNKDTAASLESIKSATYTVSKEQDSKVVEPNKTFSISTGKNNVNIAPVPAKRSNIPKLSKPIDRTYSIENKSHKSEDDTTISESFH